MKPHYWQIICVHIWRFSKTGIPKLFEPKTIKLESNKFWDGAINLLNPDGTILFEKSMGPIFKDNGMEAIVYGESPTDDPMHLNDI